MHLIPQSWSHFHILVSVCPSVGLIIALGFYVTAMLTDNAAMARTCLAAFGILGILAIPVYFSGDGSMAARNLDEGGVGNRVRSSISPWPRGPGRSFR